MELTQKKILLRLFKDSARYNASNLSAKVGLTRVGAYKALKQLECKGLLISERLGKAIFYKINLPDDYVRKTIELLLMEEARAKPRWLDEFKPLFEYSELVILFGSVLRSEERARDIDLLIIPNNSRKINLIVDEKNKILLKKAHILWQTPENFADNIRKADKVVLNAIKDGVVLYGAQKLVDIKCHIQII